MYTLYYSPGAASFAVHWLLLELDVPHRLEKVDLDGGEQRSDAYLKLNPNGRSPIDLASTWSIVPPMRRVWSPPRAATATLKRGPRTSVRARFKALRSTPAWGTSMFVLTCASNRGSTLPPLQQREEERRSSTARLLRLH